jgi:hypothetical protein
VAPSAPSEVILQQRAGWDAGVDVVSDSRKNVGEGAFRRVEAVSTRGAQGAIVRVGGEGGGDIAMRGARRGYGWERATAGAGARGSVDSGFEVGSLAARGPRSAAKWWEPWV